MDSLEVVIVAQLFPSRDTVAASEESHLRLAFDDTLLHVAVRLARVVDKASDVPLGCVNYHALIELHEVVSLDRSANQ